MKASYQKAIELYENARRAGQPTNRCQCCGAAVAEGVKGCFEHFSALLTRGYNDPRYGAAIFYGVDAHALQHPEIHGKKNNAGHLLRLCWLIEHGAHAHSASVPGWWRRYTARTDIPLLEPPSQRGSITVADLSGAATSEEYRALMRQWAEAVYAAWEAHHQWARRELARVFDA